MKYQIRCSKRRKSFAIKILRDSGDVVIYAPYTASQAKIESIINSKLDWIEKHSKITSERINLLPTLNEGSEIYIAGKVYLIAYNDNNKVFLDKKGETLSLPKNNLKGGLSAFIKAVFLPYVSKKTQYFATKFAFKYNGIKIKKLKRVWGSCTVDNFITYSLALALVPEELCDYVILHELCHTVHKNHQKLFYELLSLVLPDYKEKQKKLKEFSAYCQFLGE